ncbi:NAD(P)H-binding protein [Nonomuraea sp. SBT364]|uniref:NAD(P)H-binding protein n=1 Tax=Nonomuraea sp. SBT364 TaxID=1580530 RepID=UPI000A3EA1DB|nr:NAD(P)H-binding protein [Nonomuraea sp. SBT364]
MILVTGATGLIGRSIVELLVAEGVKVRAVSRDPGNAGLPEGVEVTGSVADGLAGVTAMFLNPRVAGSDAPELLREAKERGVGKVVVLSAINVDEPLDHQPSRLNGDRNREVEAAVVASGLEWVSLRCAAFAVNTRVAWGAQIRAGDVVRGPYANFAEAPIHERDVAEVAVRALLSDGLTGRRLGLTGPESLTHAELVTTVGEVIGRPLTFVEVPPEVVRERWVAQGMGAEFATALLARYARGDERSATVTGDVAEVLGRPALTWARWVADNADDFR